MKFIVIFLTSLAAFIGKPAYGVYIDSLRIYSNYQSADSSHLYLFAQVRVAQSPCSLNNISITESSDTTFAVLCYDGGVFTELCPRIDTIDLGVYKNGLRKVIAVFQDHLNNQCIGSFFYKDTFEFVINTDYTSITSPLSLSGLLIYPNPANDKLTCTVDKPTQNTTLQLFTTAGRTAAPAMPVTQANTEIDVSTLPAGLYFLQLQDDKQRVVKKFVKY